jgi:hypothetical protein
LVALQGFHKIVAIISQETSVLWAFQGEKYGFEQFSFVLNNGAEFIEEWIKCEPGDYPIQIKTA